MKTLITLLTATTLIAGVTTAMADQQASTEAGTSFNQSARAFDGAYGSARPSGEIRNNTVYAPSANDFQAQGSN